MPRFKTTENIFKNNHEYFDDNWMDSPFLQLPESNSWDYSRELQIEDIDIWEVITEFGNGSGVFAAWLPYAEFYLVTFNRNVAATFYGRGSNLQLEKFLIENQIPYPKC